MASSLFGNNQNPLSMMAQFNDFKKSLAGKDPNEVLNQLISSGKVTKEQYEQAEQMARQFSSLLR